jgi:hypothetical protein
VKRLLAAVLLAATALTACTSGDPEPEPVPSCVQPTSVELQGTGSLWALLFAREGEMPPVAGTEIKIVWKIGGTGDLTITATGPGDATTTPVWGPTGHGGSSWERPGTEYGTGWNFPRAGCWTMRASRSDGTEGELALAVR